jgi:hypothetical protein
MSDPNPTPNDPFHHAIDTAHQVLDNAAHWLTDERDRIAHAVASIGLSKPVAEVATVAEAVLSATLPAALTAGETAVADFLTPANLSALASIIGEINATLVKQFFTRIPAVLALPTPPAEEPIVPAQKPTD